MPSKSIKQYENAICKIIVDWDPLNLEKYNNNEYQPVLDEIFDKINKNTTINSINKIIQRSFYNNYGIYFTFNDECKVIAQQIYQEIHNKKD